MVKEAAGAGLYDTGMGRKVPKSKLFTIEELFAGKKPKIPSMDAASARHGTIEPRTVGAADHSLLSVPRPKRA